MIAGDRRYAVIYADPAWSFENFSARGEGRNAKAWYDCLSVDDIAALPIADLAADDCVLLLWVTDPFLDQAFRVIKSWGFTYKTVGLYWVKLNRRAPSVETMAARDFFTGTGYWTRANPEQCLLATRGKPSRRASATNVDRLLVDRRGEHSAKPESAYDRIEALLEGPYLELFARRTRAGWDSWGDQVGLLDAGDAPERRVPSSMERRQRELF